MVVYPNVKLNLGLHVLRRRPDGFHDIETLFVPYFGFRDTLRVERTTAAESSIELIGGAWPAQDDLSFRALKLLESDYMLPPVKITLEKHSPVGAGLGGGSSDAAFTLRAVSDLFGLGLGEARLAEYASRLGSDCAFFVYNRPMLGSGRGEILEPFDISLEDYEIEVALPEGVHVSTREAYSGVVPRSEGRKSIREILGGPVESWKESLENDFEPSVFSLYPQIESLKAEFYARGAVYAAMSGSGSAVFALMPR